MHYEGEKKEYTRSFVYVFVFVNSTSFAHSNYIYIYIYVEYALETSTLYTSHQLQ